MQAKAGKQKPATVALSVKLSAAALFVTSTQRLTKAHGLVFFALRRGETGVQCSALPDLLAASSVETLLRHGTLGTLKGTAALRRAGHEWGYRWRHPRAATQPPQQQQQTHCPTHPLLPVVLFTLLADMGVTNASEPFSVIGGLHPAVELWEEVGTPRRRPHTAAPLPPLHPLTTICINALEAIAEVTEELPPASVAAAGKEILHRQRAAKRGPTVQEDEEGEKGTDRAAVSGGAFAPHAARFFLLSPYAPYAALYRAANKAGDSENLFFGGEACDVLLVYAFPKMGGGAFGATVVCNSPEVWGRLRYQQANEEKGVVPGMRGGHHEELFFIAATLEDYLRLGSAFAWVYGWQLCYAPQGPPPRSLPWLKLFAPSALAAAISIAL
ncbi:hypothetical protein TraAM80_09425 [Trypanosoma rangeli]|uniref:Uncharacterized protein n=1 Tax=Trypanosoma rangeli TaxID=5698 RepID=A0A3R7R7C3_TRYRA|nr:uncharacterized protein TraAM80_09425 [Trypanosoma rangeli]RNE97246.1 hypothetical protein TraAM80_09425 [Trypanosoma rangeli]|eukprot:RNE97246.1 hypothetical protein TraAM80_09425 [Trypanosoma rangeli]